MQVTVTGNFCGVAEMDGPVDFEASAGCWDRDWKGKFPVKWHTTKDVPNSEFQHITFNTSENPNQISIIFCPETQQVLKYCSFHFFKSILLLLIELD